MAVRGRKPLLPSPEALGPEAVPARIRKDGPLYVGESVDDLRRGIRRRTCRRGSSDLRGCARWRTSARQYAIDNEQHGVWGGTTPP